MYIYICLYTYIYIYIYIYIYVYIHGGATYIEHLLSPVSMLLPRQVYLGLTLQIVGRGETYRACIESRIRPNSGFGKTPGKLLTLSKPNPYPQSVRTPAQKLCKIPNLGLPEYLVCGLTHDGLYGCRRADCGDAPRTPLLRAWCLCPTEFGAAWWPKGALQLLINRYG